MIEIKRMTDAERLAAAGAQAGEQVFAALCGGEMTGFCRFSVRDGCVLLLDLREQHNDLELADGMVRAAVASCRAAAREVACGGAGLLPAYQAHARVYQDGRAALEDVLRGHCARE